MENQKLPEMLYHPKVVSRNKDESVTVRLRLSKEQFSLLTSISYDLNRKQCACDLIARLLWTALEELLKDVALQTSENTLPS